ncbi:hypothetical protein RJT34_18747 [Clitoria ternatea]|uniref:Uncharacterized protein n=1 Tax=Clitoria ternatea TaxID=43366 RepID=A0AAN9PEA6_CLITE
MLCTPCLDRITLLGLLLSLLVAHFLNTNRWFDINIFFFSIVNGGVYTTVTVESFGGMIPCFRCWTVDF